MNLPIVLRAVAQFEFDEAVDWYDARKAGLGIRFANSVHNLMRAISATPNRYPIVLEDIREAIVPKYPYCIYYRVEPARVVVLAVFHTSRNPAIWQSRS